MNDSAMQVLRGLVTKYPNEPAYHYHLAVALLQDKRASEAKSESLAAQAGNPSQELAGKIQANLALVH